MATRSDNKATDSAKIKQGLNNEKLEYIYKNEKLPYTQNRPSFPKSLELTKENAEKYPNSKNSDCYVVISRTDGKKIAEISEKTNLNEIVKIKNKMQSLLTDFLARTAKQIDPEYVNQDIKRLITEIDKERKKYHDNVRIIEGRKTSTLGSNKKISYQLSTPIETVYIYKQPITGNYTKYRGEIISTILGESVKIRYRDEAGKYYETAVNYSDVCLEPKYQ